METTTTLLERMQAKGLRMTQQRRLLAELLEDAEEHLDADSLYEKAWHRDPSIHRATVYRTLNTLKKLGLVDELDLMHYAGERHFYEIRPKSFHIHLICMRCGRVDEPGGAFWEELKHKVNRETGFAPDIVRLEMGGTCVKCRPRAAKAAR